MCDVDVHVGHQIPEVRNVKANEDGPELFGRVFIRLFKLEHASYGRIAELADSLANGWGLAVALGLLIGPAFGWAPKAAIDWSGDFGAPLFLGAIFVLGVCFLLKLIVTFALSVCLKAGAWKSISPPTGDLVTWVCVLGLLWGASVVENIHDFPRMKWIGG